MAEVFADTGYWIAMTFHTDELHQLATDLTSQLGNHSVVTTETVLVEVLDHASKLGPYWRGLAANIVQNTMQDSLSEVLPQSSDLFANAVSLYASRLDQRWGLTDCISFIAMEERGITKALAYDRDFEQAGFTALLRNPEAL